MEALDKGRDWLQCGVARAHWQEVRQLAVAAGLQVPSGGHGGAWLQIDALRDALVGKRKVLENCCSTNMLNVHLSWF